MIANPESFSDNLMIPYSTFAVLKFGCWSVGLVWLVASVIALLVNKLRPSRKLTAAS